MMLASGASGGAPGTVVAVGVVLAFAAGLCWIVSLERIRDQRGGATPVRIVVLLCALWLILPPLGAFVGSWVWHPVYLDRYFVICLPAAAVLTAAGLDRVRRLGMTPTLVVITTLTVLHAVVLVRAYPS
jgi:drug/metabolite transporter (DMT)-like permease